MVAASKSGGEKKPAVAAVDGGSITAVFKLDMHCECEGHAQKIKQAVKKIKDLESVKKADYGENKLTVILKMDVISAIKEIVKKETGKNVELISALPNTATAAVKPGKSTAVSRIPVDGDINGRSSIGERAGRSQSVSVLPPKGNGKIIPKPGKVIITDAAAGGRKNAKDQAKAKPAQTASYGRAEAMQWQTNNIMSGTTQIININIKK